MHALHREAEQRYNAIRKIALQSVENTVIKSSNVQLQLRTIDKAALEASIDWNLSPERRVDWDWFEGYSIFKFRHPKRFELAIWQQNQLISLSLGRPTYRGTAMRLDFVESLPPDMGPRPQTFRIVTAALGVYADMLGAEEIRIMHPINDKVKSYYSSHGFTYHAKGDFLSKRLRGGL